jgi:hypothetical protein
MTTDGFETTFEIKVDRGETWRRLMGERDAIGPGDELWLPGFDARLIVDDVVPAASLRGIKDDEPCAGTSIVVVLEDDATGTRVRVVQSGFGDWFRSAEEMLAIGWRFIVADLQTYLTTGVHAQRHLRSWGNLGASVHADDGGVYVDDVHPDGVARRLGLRAGDLVVTFGDAPIASVDDLVTAVRAIGAHDELVCATWIRAGALVAADPVGR